jgi:hypothetical protein
LILSKKYRPPSNLYQIFIYFLAAGRIWRVYNRRNSFSFNICYVSPTRIIRTLK